MKIKRIASLLLASIMACSVFCAPASARELPDGSVPMEIEEYDYETDQVTTKTIYIDPTYTTESVSVLPTEPSAETNGLIGTEDRRTKVSPTQAPYNGIALLRFDYDGGTSGHVGTGFLVSPNVIVTAAHNIKSLQDLWAKNIRVTIGGKSYAYKSSAVSTAWTNNGHLKKDDYGVIVLAEKVTGATIFTLSSANPGTSTYTVAGYSFSNGSIGLYKHSGKISIATDSAGCSVFNYLIDAIPGQSGAPIYNSSNVAYGLHAYDKGGTEVPYDPSSHTNYRENCTTNIGVRFTSSIISFVNRSINNNA